MLNCGTVPGMRGGRVFISYRRDDSRGDSGRLYDRLERAFPGRVFRDVASIEPGVEWDDAIARVLSQTAACVVVMGKHWLEATDASGRRRLDDPNDIVRQEIAAALKRQIRVFPVLVGGARMPSEDELPEDLWALCRRNAIELPEQHWDEGVQKLIKGLETAFATPAKPPASSRKWLVVGAVAVLAAVIAVVVLVERRPSGGASDGGGAGAFQFPGNWRAVVMAPSQRTDEELEVYPDGSLRFLEHSATAALGKWQYNAAAGTLEASDIVDLNKHVRFACTWKDVSAAQASLSGTCLDRSQNAWTISLSRAPGNSAARSYIVPRLNLSGLTTGEQAAFQQSISDEICGCKMTVLTCLRKHPACPYEPKTAQDLLARFLRQVRS